MKTSQLQWSKSVQGRAELDWIHTEREKDGVGGAVDLGGETRVGCRPAPPPKHCHYRLQHNTQTPPCNCLTNDVQNEVACLPGYYSYDCDATVGGAYFLSVFIYILTGLFSHIVALLKIMAFSRFLDKHKNVTKCRAYDIYQSFQSKRPWQWMIVGCR